MLLMMPIAFSSLLLLTMNLVFVVLRMAKLCDVRVVWDVA